MKFTDKYAQQLQAPGGSFNRYQKFAVWACSPELEINLDDETSWGPWWDCNLAGFTATCIFNLGCSAKELAQLAYPANFEFPMSWRFLGDEVDKADGHPWEIDLAERFIWWADLHKLPATNWVAWWRCFLNGCVPQ